MQTESPNTPALNTARAELTDIATNPENPRHLGYGKGDPQVMQYLDSLYKKAAPGTGGSPMPPSSVHIGGTDSLSLGPADPQPGETPEEAEIRTRNEVILAPLKQEWGPHYETRFAAARATAGTLFEGQGEMLDTLGAIVRMEYGPKGEAAALKFFAELHDLKHGGGL